MPSKSDFNIINRELYAYTAILRQLAAKYNNEELHAQIQILLNLYEDVTSPDFDIESMDIELIHDKLDELRICIFNLHVITVNYEHRDLQPVCIYLSDLVHQVKAALGEEDDEALPA